MVLASAFWIGSGACLLSTTVETIRMNVDIAVIIMGLSLMVGLAYVIIQHSVSLAETTGLSGTFIGLTILSIGTSVPEIVIHIVGSLRILGDAGQLHVVSALVIGNNIGSDIFQQNMVIPLVGLIGAVAIERKDLGIELGVLIAASVAVWIAAMGGVLSRLEGGAMVAAYGTYLVVLVRRSGQEKGPRALAPKRTHRSPMQAAGWIVMGLMVMAVVADRVLDSVEDIIARLPVSASLFGVIIFGLASAFPELSTSLVAAMKQRREISAGILIGSNITNPLLGLGIGALLSTYSVPEVVIWYDLPVKIGTAGLLYAFFARGRALLPMQCLILIGLFVLYLCLRVIWFPEDQPTM